MKLINMDDEIFKAYCYENFDADKNGIVTADEVADVHILTITSMGIKSLKGIEYFTNLSSLYCSGNGNFRIKKTGANTAPVFY